MISFVHDVPGQRVVFAPGAVVRIADEAAHLGLNRALVIATPGSGARLGGRLVEILGARATGLHAQASLHVPKPVAEEGVPAPPAPHTPPPPPPAPPLPLSQLTARPPPP